jgi:hypothetical protein
VTTTPPIIPTPRRRWLQFTLRTMLVLILIVSVPLGWFAHKLREAREHRAAVKAIQTLGGRVGSWPDRLGRLPGEEVYGDLVWVNLSRTPVRDAGLVYLRGLRTLYRLNLDATKVTDAGLVHLNGLTQLEELSLDSTQITDAGLEHLRGLTQLRTVDLRNTQVTDKGVNELQKALPNVSIER